MTAPKNQYFFDFHIKRDDPKESGQLPALTTRIVLSGIHNFLRSEQKANVGVAFPKWQQGVPGKSIPEIGKTVRVISDDHETLYAMRGNAWFTCQILAGDISVSSISLVPEGAEQVCYVRNREAEMAARELRELTGKPVNILDLNSKSDDPAARLRFMTAQKTVNMLIKRVPVSSALPGDFSSYGLCCKEKMVSVPEF